MYVHSHWHDSDITLVNQILRQRSDSDDMRVFTLDLRPNGGGRRKELLGDPKLADGRACEVIDLLTTAEADRFMSNPLLSRVRRMLVGTTALSLDFPGPFRSWSMSYKLLGSFEQSS